jgi:hypothetical protein
MAKKISVLKPADQRCPTCQLGLVSLDTLPEGTDQTTISSSDEDSTSIYPPTTVSMGFCCEKCLLFNELAVALRLSVGTLRNWKYEGLLRPIHSIGRRPHFRIDLVQEDSQERKDSMGEICRDT